MSDKFILEEPRGEAPSSELRLPLKKALHVFSVAVPYLSLLLSVLVLVIVSHNIAKDESNLTEEVKFSNITGVQEDLKATITVQVLRKGSARGTLPNAIQRMHIGCRSIHSLNLRQNHKNISRRRALIKLAFLFSN